MTPVTYTFSSPIGIVRLTEEQGAITHIALTERCDASSSPSPLMCEAERQLMEYLNGTRQQMDFAIRMEGTPFQLRVWQALHRFPTAQHVPTESLPPCWAALVQAVLWGWPATRIPCCSSSLVIA